MQVPLFSYDVRNLKNNNKNLYFYFQALHHEAFSSPELQSALRRLRHRLPPRQFFHLVGDAPHRRLKHRQIYFYILSLATQTQLRLSKTILVLQPYLTNKIYKLQPLCHSDEKAVKCHFDPLNSFYVINFLNISKFRSNRLV